MDFLRTSKIRYHLCGLSILIATGCAHVPSTSKNSAADLNSSAPKTLTGVLQEDISDVQSDQKPLPKALLENREVVYRGVKLRNSRFDLPVVMNSRVEYWIDYFTGRGRGFFQKYLERSKFFIPYIAPVLKQNGLPEDLVYLAMIESGFNNLARSRARAVGPWQFIAPTGKRYGLMVNWWVDKRRDIQDSTRAAAEYLKDLFQMFQSWELAAAAYNAGEAKVARAIHRFGTKDFWEIARHRFLRPETRDYVPKMFAAAIISKNRAQFGFKDDFQIPGADEVVAGDGEIVKVVKTDKPTEDPEYKNEKAADLKAGMDADPLVASAELDEESDNSDSEDEKESEASRITEQPLATPQLVSAETQAPVPLAKPIPTPHVTKKGEVGGEELAEFEVKSPADLLKIARAAGLSYQTVKSLNPELLRWCTPPTARTYRIKLPASTKEKFLATYNHEAFPRQVQFMTYKTRRGETLTRIAHHFGIKVDPMSDLNRISPKVPLRSGVKVLLPMPSDRSRTFASLEVRDPPERRRVRRHGRHRHRFYKVTYRNRAGSKIASKNDS